MRLDYERLAAELLRALRGRRPQRLFSRRLGYRSNVAYRWETARCFPTAAEALRIASQAGVDVDQAVTRFLRADVSWPSDVRPSTAEGVRLLLQQLRGSESLTVLAQRSRFNRFSLSRWLRGPSEPKLPELLELIELLSQRALDFVATLVDPAKLPHVARRWARLEASRQAAYEHPWSHVILRALELEAYRALGRHRTGWLAQRLHMPLEEEQRCLELLRAAGQVRRAGGLWVSTQTGVVDTRAHPERSRALKRFWMELARESFERGLPGIYGYNLMAVSREALPRLRKLHLEYFQAMRSLIAESDTGEQVVLFCAELVTLDGEEQSLQRVLG